MRSHMPVIAKRSTLKPEVEFQYDANPALVSGCPEHGLSNRKSALKCTLWSQCTPVPERRTDGRTDRRTNIMAIARRFVLTNASHQTHIRQIIWYASEQCISNDRRRGVLHWPAVQQRVCWEGHRAMRRHFVLPHWAHCATRRTRSAVLLRPDLLPEADHWSC